MRYLNIRISQYISSSQLYFWSSTHTFCSWKIALSFQQLNSASRKICLRPLPFPPLSFQAESKAHWYEWKSTHWLMGVFICTASYTTPSQYVTVLLTQGTGQVRCSGCMAVKSNLMDKPGGRSHVPFGVLPVKGFLSYMYISMHGNYAVVKSMTKILKHGSPLSYKNYHSKRTGVKFGESKGRIWPCWLTSGQDLSWREKEGR